MSVRQYRSQKNDMLISYAQNFEDVMLWRALKHVDKGFYIDVGAAWPDEDSVTKVFYDAGWHGINVEPNSGFFQMLQEQRERDINLPVAIGDSIGHEFISLFPGSGLSTLDAAIAQKHVDAEFSVERQKIEITTLVAIWNEFVPQGQDVHFLKVDVEGFEEKVLRGNDWQQNRPWIVVVEATVPMEKTESFTAWEPILLGAGYKFVYADGLNRFYVAKEHSELLGTLKYPPNVFDGFITSQQFQTELRTRQAEAQAKEAEANRIQANERADQALQLANQAEERIQIAEANTSQANERAAQLHDHSQWLQNEWDLAKAKNNELNHSSHHWQTVSGELNNELQSVYSSKSWRITWPLRKLMQLLMWLLWLPINLAVGLVRTVRWFVRGSFAWFTLRPGSRPRRTARLFLLHLRNWVLLRPRIKIRVLSILKHFPRLLAWLRYLHYANSTQAMYSSAPSIIDDVPMTFESSLSADALQKLTPRARKIYVDLQLAVARQQQENS